MESSYDNNKFGVRASLRKTLYVLGVIYGVFFSYQYVAYPKYIQIPIYNFGDETMYSFNTASTVYPIARKMAAKKNVTLVHCESTPSVDVGDQKGYKIITRLHWEPRVENTNRTNCLYRELVLVPKEGSKVFSIDDVRWDEIKKLGKFQSVYMGYDDKYHWFSRMEIFEQNELRSVFNLQGGDEQFTLLVNDLLRTKNEVERSRKLRYKTTTVGARSIPILKAEIDRGTTGSIPLLWSIPEEESFLYIIKLYEQDKHKEIIRDLVNRPKLMGNGHAKLSTVDSGIRPEAKEIYLDFLTIAYNEGTYKYRDLSQSLKAISRYKLMEALDIVKKLNQNPRTLSNYIDTTLAIRSLEQSPVDPSLFEARDVICKVYSEPNELNYNEFIQAREVLYLNDEQEGLLLVALSLVKTAGRFSVDEIHFYGYEILLWFPEEFINEMIDQLILTLGNDRNLHALQEAKRMCAYYREQPDEWSKKIEQHNKSIDERRVSTPPQAQTHSQAGV